MRSRPAWPLVHGARDVHALQGAEVYLQEVVQRRAGHAQARGGLLGHPPRPRERRGEEPVRREGHEGLDAALALAHAVVGQRYVQVAGEEVPNVGDGLRVAHEEHPLRDHVPGHVLPGHQLAPPLCASASTARASSCVSSR